MIESLLALAITALMVANAGMLADTMALALRFRRTTVTSLLLITAAASILFALLFGSMAPIQYVGRAQGLAVALICAYHGYETLEHDYLSRPAMGAILYVALEALNSL